MIIPESVKVSYNVNLTNYNEYIDICKKCFRNCYSHFRHGLGFTDAPFIGESESFVAFIWRCPYCDKIQWHHASKDTIRIFQRVLHNKKIGR